MCSRLNFGKLKLMSKAIKTLSKTVAIENSWTRIFSEKIQYSSGNQGDYIVVERSPAIGILPVFNLDGLPHTCLVSQYRYPIEQDILQFPMGGMDINKNVIEQAQIELEQETGLRMKRFVEIAKYYVDPGLSRQVTHVILATEIESKGTQQLEASEEGLNCKIVPINYLSELIDAGKFVIHGP